MSEKIENLLPPDIAFDATVGEYREVLLESIEALRQDQQDVLSVADELDNEMVLLWQYTALLAQLLIGEGEDLAQVHPVIYRATCFVLQVTSAIATSNASSSLPIGDYFGTESDERLAILSRDTQEYLGARLELSAFIAHMMPEIDTTTRYGHHAETAMALVFMLRERAVAAQYLANDLDWEQARDLPPSSDS